MMKKKYFLSLLALTMTISILATDHTINIAGLTYTPDNLVVQIGDNVTIDATASHPGVEVSNVTWDADDDTPLPGGFGPFTEPFTFTITDTDTIFYVCVNHVNFGMKGRIVVQSAVDGCTDAMAANYDPLATVDDGSCLYDVTFNVDMNCESGFIQPALEGPYFGWCGGCVPLTDPDMDGIWSVTVQIPAGPFEYKYAVDDFAGQENLIDDMVNGGECAPITDFSSFANREVEVVAGLVLNDSYGTCGICDPLVGCTDPLANNFSETAITDDGSCLYDVTFNVDLNCYDANDPNIENSEMPGPFTTIAIEGPSFGWCGSCVTLVDNGNGIWSITLSLPAGPFEYKYAHDFFVGQEQLIDDMVNGGTCAPITDFDIFANREITIPATLTTNDTYGSCDACDSGCPTDFNVDGVTNGDDFSTFLGNFGLACPMAGPCQTDLNGDLITNGDDFSIFLGNFGLDCE